MAIHPVVRAIVKRDLKRWFGNPTGYVFITLFVFLCTVAQFWPDRFFQNNLANLDTLNAAFPYLLLFFIPAVTMAIWAGERSQGTDELLLTLPATDGQIVLGKYLAAVGVYTVALAFNFPLMIFLEVLGDPDWGLLIANFFGFWLLGLLLTGAGMIGSQLSDNLTVAFILGAMITAMVVLAESILSAIFPELTRGWVGYGPVSLFQELGRGVVSIPTILLFVGLIVAMLYMNVVLLSRRHWKELDGMHLGIRFSCVLVGAVALTGIGANTRIRVDTTSEQIHSLSSETRDLIRNISPDRPIFIHAFISPEVPREYVQTRRTLLDLLTEFDALGGDKVQLRIVETERYSDEAREAEANFGIRHVTRLSDVGGKLQEIDVYMGLAFTSGLEEVVVPFFDVGLPVEYELTRSLRVVASATRRKVGILDTDAKLFGGFDFQSMRQDPEWEIVRELKLQYDVERVSADADYAESLDVLVVAMASSLTQEQMDRLGDYIMAGNPTLIIDDPMPISSQGLGPTDPKGGPRNPFTQQNQPPPQPKGNIRGLLQKINIRWPYTAVIWDTYNPHPQLNFDPELVFVGAGSGASQPFNPDEPVSAGLQEIVAMYGGYVESGNNPDMRFVGLLSTTRDSGTSDIREMFTTTFLGTKTLNPRRRYRQDNREKYLACRVSGKADPGAEKEIDVVMLTDLDMISSQFFSIRRQGHEQFQFDNVTFLLNCVDSLAGDTSFIELRKRRPKHRTLILIKEQEQEFKKNWLREKEAAETKAESDVTEAKARFEQKVAEVRDSSDLDEQSKAIRIQAIQDVEQRRLNVRQEAIDDQKNQAVDRAMAERIDGERKIRKVYRFGTLFVAPIPGLLVGLAMYFRRRRRDSDPSRGVITPGGAA